MSRQNYAEWPHLTGEWWSRSRFYESSFRAEAVMEAAGCHTVRRSQDPAQGNLMHLLAPGGEVEAHDLGGGWVRINMVDLGAPDPRVRHHSLSGEQRDRYFRLRAEAYTGFW